MMDFYTITVPPAELPVTLAEVKTYLRVTNSAEDGILSGLIQAVVNELENYTGRFFISRTVMGEYDRLEWSKFERFSFAELRRSPLGAVTSVSVIEDGGTTDVTTDTELKDTAGYARVLFPEMLPTPKINEPRPLQIVFTAGYGDATAVPEEIKTAIKMGVNFYFRNRGDCGAECGNNKASQSPVIQGALSNYKILTTFA
jgi:uncharacterized phiE125 gp8 family phage protein